MLLLNKLYSETWLATEQVIKDIENVLLRHEHTKLSLDDLKALEAERGKPLENNPKIKERGSTRIIPIHGSIVKRGDFLTDVSGMTSTTKLAFDITEAISDEKIESIVLDIDSGGGVASGISPLADLIHAGTKVKPIIAFTDGSAQSAAFWIASACTKIVADDTAVLGSIGVAAFIPAPKEGQARELVFKSTKTPNKLADPATKLGSKLLQDRLDSMFEVFAAKTVSFRNNDRYDPEKLAGNSLVGEEALAAGLCDEIGSFESLIKELNPKEKIMDNPVTEVSVETASEEKFEALEAQIKAYTEKESTYAAQIKEYEEKLQAAEEFEALAQEKLLVAEAEQAATSLGGKLTPTQKPFYVELYKEVSGDPKMLQALDAIVGTQIDIKVLTEEQLADEDLLVLTDEIPDDELSELKKETAEFLKKENKHVKR